MEQNIPLSFTLGKRLRAVGEQVRPGCRLVDVGTDHAYLPATLLAEEKISFAYASDVNKKPLESAKRTLSGINRPNQWEVVLADGLAGVNAKLVEDVVIAGVGYDLLISFLEKAPEFWTLKHHFVLQPMTGIEKVRVFLAENGFVVHREQAVTEKGHLYSVMDVSYTGEKHSLSQLEAWCGPHLWQKDDHSIEYLEARLYSANQVVHGLSRAKVLSETEGQLLTEMREISEELSEHLCRMKSTERKDSNETGR